MRARSAAGRTALPFAEGRSAYARKQADMCSKCHPEDVSSSKWSAKVARVCPSTRFCGPGAVVVADLASAYVVGLHVHQALALRRLLVEAPHKVVERPTDGAGLPVGAAAFPDAADLAPAYVVALHMHAMPALRELLVEALGEVVERCVGAVLKMFVNPANERSPAARHDLPRLPNCAIAPLR